MTFFDCLNLLSFFSFSIINLLAFWKFTYCNFTLSFESILYFISFYMVFSLFLTFVYFFEEIKKQTCLYLLMTRNCLLLALEASEE